MLDSLPARSESSAAVHDPLAMRAMRCAVSASMPRRAMSACSMASSLMRLKSEALCAAAYGFEQFLRFLAHEDEDGLLRRFLKQLEYLVSRGDIHALGQPHHAHLVSTLRRLHAQSARESVALSSGDDGLLVLGAHRLHPLLYAEVGSIAEQLAPFLGVVVAHGLVVGAHRGLLYGGEAEVEVGVLPLAQQLTVA